MSLVRGMEHRDYQKRIVNAAAKSNTLVCLPTGLGKTNIAILLASERLEQFPDSQILVVAPTKPLVAQHLSSFKEFLTLPSKHMQIITGATPPSQRGRLYGKQLIFATPQTIQKDLENEQFSLENFSLLVIDEIHHATGKYAYPYIAQRFANEATHPRILGLTASPGSKREKIKTICKNTCIDSIEIASEADPDVKSYIKKKEMEWVEVTLPDRFLSIQQQLLLAYRERTKRLGVKTKRELLWLQQRLRKNASTKNPAAFGLLSRVAQAIKIEHALSLLETQGISVLLTYLKKLNKEDTKAAKALMKSQAVSNAFHLTQQLADEGSTHPKMSKLCSLILNEFKTQPESKIIIFANYRDTVKEITRILSALDDVRPAILVGQREGVNQKQQLETIQRYGDGEYNCLVTTSIGEEGLHLESADLALFYEAVPSEIRQIQRRGRVGRTKVGKIKVLITKGTRDEAFRWAAHQREKKMTRTLQSLRHHISI